ncbi:MAG: 2-amino-4-hydroxy-6-hydroxymethyldihydropteridine diphosphokinase [Verrucomicrobiota bacterium]|nr:2-amino-4-hydroxy-6-hydroxymethyldihydropteridine diphosphokinase [Verrucomicrobiota bacterium]
MSDDDLYVGFGVGGNLEDSIGEVLKALDFLHGLKGFSNWRGSALYRSSPIDCPPGSPDFVNAVAVALVDPNMEPTKVLITLQEYEKQRGRPEVRDRNSPRPVDLDILFWGQQQRVSTLLTLPHPRMMLRRFVLEPLVEVLPDYVDPVTQQMAVDILFKIPVDPLLKRIEIKEP